MRRQLRRALEAGFDPCTAARYAGRQLDREFDTGHARGRTGTEAETRRVFRMQDHVRGTRERMRLPAAADSRSAIWGPVSASAAVSSYTRPAWPSVVSTRAARAIEDEGGQDGEGAIALSFGRVRPERRGRSPSPEIAGAISTSPRGRGECPLSLGRGRGPAPKAAGG